MGRRRWQHYQQLFMENVQLKEDDYKQMEEKDWESSDKCNFCDESSNTSQQTVDNIVPKSQEQPKKKSHSSESSYETEDCEEDTVADFGSSNNSTKFAPSPAAVLSTNRTSGERLESDIPRQLFVPKHKFNSMSSLESVASSVASMAAVANITLQKSLGTLRFPSTLPAEAVMPQWYLPQPNLKFETSAAKKDESDTEMADDQPLDLSAKSCSPVNSPTERSTEASSPVFTSAQSFPSSMVPPSPQPALKVYNSNKHLLDKTKHTSRPSPMASRRTYTEDELQAALRDIQSGKLGTRRAAVIYGIPRSTLRNKVYKLAMEKERGSAVVHIEDTRNEREVDLPSDDKEELEDRDPENEEEDEDIDKESSANEEEKEIEKSFIKPSFTVEDLIRLSKTQQNATSPLVESESLRALFQSNSFLAEQSAKHKEKDSVAAAAAAVASSLPPPLYSIFPPGAAEIWGNLDPSSIAPYLNHLVAVTRENFNISNLLAQHQNPYFRQNCMNDGGSSSGVSETPFSPKLGAPLLPELMQRMLAESDEQQKSEARNESRPYSSSPTAASSMTSSDLACDERGNTSPNILNRLPFFKPSYKNGSSTAESAFCNMEYSNENRTSEGSEKSTTLSPPPSSSAMRSESSSPLLPVNQNLSKVGGLNLRDVIAKTIGQRFQQPDIAMNTSSHLSQVSPASLEAAQRLTSYSSHAANSVIKSHSSMQTDEHHRKICATQSKVPSLTSASVAVAGMSSASAMAGAAAGSGKGTRPKRGKYRNYDRDSLIEAVRAVQRGEMSVHRAGSHFGVPHSTLEYKVKERHLLRPRKREPKNPLSDELKRRDDGVIRLSMDKPPSSTIGTTVPITATAQHSPSSQQSKLKVVNNSTSGGKSQFSPPPHLSTSGSTPNGLKIPTALFDGSHPFVPAPPFPFWPAHFHQLAMEYSHNPAAVAAAAAAALSSNPEQLLATHFMRRMQEETKSNTSLGLNALGKNAREVAESLYDGSGINGNFLDGVIRSSLDNDQVFSDSMHKKSILEQLYKNKYMNSSNSCQGDESDGEEGGGSDGGSGSKSTLNQILAQTLLSSLNVKERMAQIPAPKGDDSNDDGKDDVSTEVKMSMTDRDELMKNARIDEKNAESRSNIPNQSLNVESHVVNAEIKTEKN